LLNRDALKSKINLPILISGCATRLSNRIGGHGIEGFIYVLIHTLKYINVHLNGWMRITAMMTQDKRKNPEEMVAVPEAVALINLDSIRSISIRITHNWSMDGSIWKGG
jgi:hypothetical protein